ncbi:hypothetical protein NHX12_033709 [Muraenolepis orangiensis]|uniref:C3H1-type domain-containing protein n=1 Tax=Muraenolepis orangiensis TaxID=630683 RepID=A0A9Q0E4G0_9TELE|nr:hypothetical protein NHX12_033709 [Muraenolepis orangiensis]
MEDVNSRSEAISRPPEIRQQITSSDGVLLASPQPGEVTGSTPQLHPPPSTPNHLYLHPQQTLPPPPTDSTSTPNRLYLHPQQTLPPPPTDSTSTHNRLYLHPQQTLPPPTTDSTSTHNRLYLHPQQTLPPPPTDSTSTLHPQQTLPPPSTPNQLYLHPQQTLPPPTTDSTSTHNRLYPPNASTSTPNRLYLHPQQTLPPPTTDSTSTLHPQQTLPPPSTPQPALPPPSTPSRLYLHPQQTLPPPSTPQPALPPPSTPSRLYLHPQQTLPPPPTASTSTPNCLYLHPPSDRHQAPQQHWRGRDMRWIGGSLYRVSANKLSRTVAASMSINRTGKWSSPVQVCSQTPPGGRPSSSRHLASRAVQRSLAIIRNARSRKQQQRNYCMYYNRFGKCNRGDACPFIHDPDKVAVCTRFLRGTCKQAAGTCPFSHRVDKEKSPVCLLFPPRPSAGPLDVLLPHTHATEAPDLSGAVPSATLMTELTSTARAMSSEDLGPP